MVAVEDDRRKRWFIPKRNRGDVSRGGAERRCTSDESSCYDNHESRCCEAALLSVLQLVSTPQSFFFRRHLLSAAILKSL